MSQRAFEDSGRWKKEPLVLPSLNRGDTSAGPEIGVAWLLDTAES